jgi:hypothetical protein
MQKKRMQRLLAHWHFDRHMVPFGGLATHRSSLQ